MVKKRVLIPKSVWDEDEVVAAFASAGVKPIHVKRLYRSIQMAFLASYI
jgi:hypothetical protein